MSCTIHVCKRNSLNFDSLSMFIARAEWPMDWIHKANIDLFIVHWNIVRMAKIIFENMYDTQMLQTGSFDVREITL